MGHAQLCDFRLSHVLDGLPIEQTVFVLGGTLQFMAPELLLEDLHPTTDSDIYAFGCTCIQVSGSAQRLGQLELSIAS
jgi:serine/threonine protein kinase